MASDSGTTRDEARVLLRYRYRDGTLQAALPMRVVQDDDTLVSWLSSGTQIMYWALPNGDDPRSVPLLDRFNQVLSTGPREWQGNGVLRVMPRHEPFQVLHFWDDDGAFAGWYVNFEAPRRRRGDRVDSVDWHLDLWIDPDGTPTWKDEDEADAAIAAGHLDRRTSRRPERRAWRSSTTSRDGCTLSATGVTTCRPRDGRNPSDFRVTGTPERSGRRDPHPTLTEGVDEQRVVLAHT